MLKTWFSPESDFRICRKMGNKKNQIQDIFIVYKRPCWIMPHKRKRAGGIGTKTCWITVTPNTQSVWICIWILFKRNRIQGEFVVSPFVGNSWQKMTLEKEPILTRRLNGFMTHCEMFIDPNANVNKSSLGRV